MKGLAILISGLLVSVCAYSAVYETEKNGITDFSNTLSQGAKKLDLKDDPVTVIDVDSIPKNIVWGNNQRTSRYTLNPQNTMQADFPEQLTDNYYDFYGRNHNYNSLMSSTMGLSMYSPNDANNMRLQNNY